MGKATNKYPLPRIVDEIMAKYELTGPNDTEEQKKQVRDNLYRAIKGICEKTPVKYGSRKTLWEATKTPSSPSKEGKSTKPRYKFTEKQKHQLLDSLELKKYLSVRTRSDKCKKKLEEDIQIFEQNKEEDIKIFEQNKEEAAQRNNINWLGMGAYNDEDEQREYSADLDCDFLHKRKIELMIEAIFLKFYEPTTLDDLLKWIDDRRESLVDNMEHTAESVAASKRLQDISNYCKPKDPDKN